jgi:hypothetical protein
MNPTTANPAAISQSWRVIVNDEEGGCMRRLENDSYPAPRQNRLYLEPVDGQRNWMSELFADYSE